jgi:hypothetical protein
MWGDVRVAGDSVAVMNRIGLWLAAGVAVLCWLGTLLAFVPLPISVIATIVVGWLALRRFRPGAAAEVGRVVCILLVAAIALALLGGDAGTPELAIVAVVAVLAIWWPHRPGRSHPPERSVRARDREAQPQRIP